MRKFAIPVICAALMLGTSGCGLFEWAAINSPGASNQTKGTVIGASQGAQVGAAIGDITSGWHDRGSHTLAGAAIGAVAGGLIGNVIGSSMDQKSQQPVQQQQSAQQSDDVYGDGASYYGDGTQTQRFYAQSTDDNAVHFDHGSFQLTRGEQKKLNSMIKQLRRDPTATVEIYGHTDNDGNRNKLQEVSLNRAMTVKHYLMSRGVKESQIYCQGCADQYPVASNSTPAGRAQNRRVEVVLTHNTASEPAEQAPATPLAPADSVATYDTTGPTTIQ